MGKQRFTKLISQAHKTIVEDRVEKQDGIKAITKKYGLMAKMMMRGPDEGRAIIKLTNSK
jgi:hypothetical protein